ncbi:MAG: dihydroneopterin triphosphate diphosphatase [Gammaproteobacteria bacterium]|nr:dihydroneopterin triphosphate diphosphatase [Gammaproteobacteria bacterium]
MAPRRPTRGADPAPPDAAGRASGRQPDGRAGGRRGEHHGAPAAGDSGSRFKRPESVLVVVYTRTFDCLLLERLQPPGFWQSVTGSLQWGESAAEAAARELREETGLDADGLRDAGVSRRFAILPEWRARYAPGVAYNVEHLWYLELPERRPVALNPREHADCRWLALEDAIATVSSWTNREALERLRT